MAEVSAIEIISLREDISQLRGAMDRVAGALERLARLEERHNNSASAIQRGFEEITKVNVRVDAQDARIKVLEVAQPTTKKYTKWMDNALYGAAVVVIMVILKKAGLL